MVQTTAPEAVLDYFPCRYGKSKLLFRGPRRRMEDEFAVFLGGAETYGRFIDTPFPALVELETGLPSVNLGCVNAGLDIYCNDRSLIEICNKAKVTIVQIMGATNMSNRYYQVHPRRNDRFLCASKSLQALYPDVDFTEFSFTGHLLQTLQDISHDKFLIVVEELKESWLARQRKMLGEIGGKIILLWMSDQTPPDTLDGAAIDADPAFIDQSMVKALGDLVHETIEVISMDIERFHGMNEMVFEEKDRRAAEEMLGPLVHRRTAVELSTIMRRIAP